MKLLLIVTLCLLACFADNVMVNQTGTHSCRWDNCPYNGKEIPSGADLGRMVYHETGCPESSDCWTVDVLHLEYPEKDYDELEDLMFNPKTDQ